MRSQNSAGKGRKSNNDNGNNNRYAVLNQVDPVTITDLEAKKVDNAQVRNKEVEITSKESLLKGATMSEIMQEKKNSNNGKRAPHINRASRENVIAKPKSQSMGYVAQFDSQTLTMSNSITVP
ncbi:hypothetical protein REPUB_Repub01dG0084100 [Reevesia pubescens]